MATTLDNLITARDNLATKLNEATENPKPSYSIDGASVSWSEYLAMLTAQMEAINGLIIAYQPYIHTSQVL